MLVLVAHVVRHRFVVNGEQLNHTLLWMELDALLVTIVKQITRQMVLVYWLLAATLYVEMVF